MFGKLFRKKTGSENEPEKKLTAKPESADKQKETANSRQPVESRQAAQPRQPVVKHVETAQPNKADAMVPLFSWQSISIIVIGLIIGVALGLAYWAFSPAAVVVDEDEPVASGGFLQSLGIGPAAPTEPWKSELRIQIVNPGSTLVQIGQLANIGIYYAAKAKSLPFLQFLSNDLMENTPMYQHSVDELDQIIATKYDSSSEQPAILLMVTTPTAEEALFLTSRIPLVFQEFLIAEEKNQQIQARENILQAIEDVKKAIIQAEQEVSALEAEGVSIISSNPTYIAIDTKVQALEMELLRQANLLATIASLGGGESEVDVQREYNNTLAEIELVKKAILEAEQEVNTLSQQKAATDIINLPGYLTLTAEITALEARINTIMNGGVDTTTGLPVMGLAEMIANGVSTGSAYEDAKKKLATTSEALSSDKKQLAILESQVSEEQLTLGLEIKLAQATLDNLNVEFTTLLQRLNELASQDTSGNTQADFERTSAALAQARQEMATLQATLVGTQLPQDLDYQVAQARIDTLNNELTVLNNSLSTTMVSTGEASTAINSLAVGNPSIPEIVFPERVKARNALAIGALLGMIIAWAILNRQWLKKAFVSSDEKTES